ncbi:MAG: 1-deoxy-D-xylulose-5-phosphate reductoisomerase [Gemmatimonadetes bacterium]|nr:1-deoxy-D-xylulose-5-phosphate reductoisomerase [Gemmatimonadota bacterium]NIQ59104.1 1-deoxy-D-xylulose-5-phosphate reductoisomerase [Gemmatimonadota bacterium]NIU79307.1 1-deoxy-D-xylulose-5-phosphate reductoisomerase [Gammaproteobacteria bacterium]NIX47979.1 1-deoxy-D-xylulose-5-phosphate reductoisomerase [Gemmatimonadota bacterium]NIY12352.1 1-deoxy-D-xylulose-5-phosphate reductoisomerase [Gemmatimonadota bacterium]
MSGGPGVAILGSTGSIGRSTLSVLDRHRDRFRVVALAARRDVDTLGRQAERHRDARVYLTDDVPAPEGWGRGPETLIEVATAPDVDIVVNAVVGAAGLEATLAALEAGKRLALANKESLVAGGPLVMDALRRGGGELIPVDSEHSAILQCLPGGAAEGVRRLILTASGGPFRDRTAEDLERVRPQDALRHPTWDMGAKITIDSATLANKALEVIEAHFLFGLAYDRIEAVVHPQSIIHSMVEFDDGSVLSQMGFPTMELPILYALTHPDRVEDGVRRFDPVEAGPLTFEPVDHTRFPTFGLGVAAGRAGGTAPAVYNAANEEAVAAFLDETLRFVEIPRVIERTLAACGAHAIDSLAAVRAADGEARSRARALIEESH